jgi:hypothetical protein
MAALGILLRDKRHRLWDSVRGLVKSNNDDGLLVPYNFRNFIIAHCSA